LKIWIQKNTVFSISLLFTIFFVITGIFFNETLSQIASSFLSGSIEYFGWFYLMATLTFLVFATYLLFSRFGKIVLGDPTDKPSYSTASWLAMLFSAGMGIGLLFWGVAEPVYHYVTPPTGDGSTAESANLAMTYTYFHWGLHPWAIYTVVGVSLAFFQFRKKLPGLISSAFYPLLGDRVNGSIGKAIDILAVVATVFGVATSLGLGTMQIAGGMSKLFGLENSTFNQILIICVITLLFIASAWSGLNRGIKLLSNLNMILAISLMLLLIILGPTAQIFKVFTNTMGSYLDGLLYMSLNVKPFGDNSWIAGWTLFYWAWWIAWAPFVGSFIARISRGRTIKEFIMGVLFIPTLGTFVWFSIFGGSALHFINNLGNTALADIVASDMTLALFAFFEYFPMSSLLSILAIILICTFFITSADSATVVLGIFSTNGDLNPSNVMKVIWGVILSAVAVVLLISESLSTLQTASIAAAFPFAIVMLGMCYCLIKGLQTEKIEVRQKLEHLQKMNELDEKEIM
jgi:glycine betaine transporter